MKSAGTSLPEIGRFHDDPNQSYTLPGTYYYDPSVYAAELGAIFSRTWQYVCHVSRLQAAGDYAVRDIGDQSVVALRSADGQLRAYHNVCRHRAHRLLEGSGQTGTAIVCPYHNWTYRLSGELLSARHSAEVEDFNVEEFCLYGVRVETFCGFVFVNLDDDAEPLLQGLEELEWEIRELSPQLDELKLADLEAIRLVLRGGSVIDWHRLNFRDVQEAHEFIRSHEIDLEIEIEEDIPSLEEIVAGADDS